MDVNAASKLSSNQLQSYKAEQVYRIGTKQEVIDSAKKLLKEIQGCIKDKDGNLIVYDDQQPKYTWDGTKITFEEYKKKCIGKPTIGYGQTALNEVKKGKITQKYADELLIKKIENVYNTLQKKFKEHFTEIGINQKVALISLYYNIGLNFDRTPKLVASLLNDDLEQVVCQMSDINKTTINGQKVISVGLNNRRQKEISIFSHDLTF